MNVGRLRELIKDMPDSAPVLVSVRDHAYRECSVEDTTVGMVGPRRDSHFCEWFGEEHRSVGERPVRALVIR